jgi:hypothetical protein
MIQIRLVDIRMIVYSMKLYLPFLVFENMVLLKIIYPFIIYHH